MPDKYNVMATIRRLVISGFDADGRAILCEKHYDQIFLEGFKSKAEAMPYAKSAAQDPHVVTAWVQRADIPLLQNHSE